MFESTELIWGSASNSFSRSSILFLYPVPQSSANLPVLCSTASGRSQLFHYQLPSYSATSSKLQRPAYSRNPQNPPGPSSSPIITHHHLGILLNFDAIQFPFSHLLNLNHLSLFQESLQVTHSHRTGSLTINVSSIPNPPPSLIH
jgi:hypothetical protein